MSVYSSRGGIHRAVGERGTPAQPTNPGDPWGHQCHSGNIPHTQRNKAPVHLGFQNCQRYLGAGCGDREGGLGVITIRGADWAGHAHIRAGHWSTALESKSDQVNNSIKECWCSSLRHTTAEEPEKSSDTHSIWKLLSHSLSRTVYRGDNHGPKRLTKMFWLPRALLSYKSKPMVFGDGFHLWGTQWSRVKRWENRTTCTIPGGPASQGSGLLNNF